MNFKDLRIPLVSLLIMTAACGRSTVSTTQGHYEDANASSMGQYRGQQVIPAEYARSEAVIISSSLLSSYGREDLVKAMLETGIGKVWVTVGKGSAESLQSSTFSRLRQTLGADINRVRVIAQKDTGSVSVWARDWSPLGALSTDDRLRFLDLNYYPSRPADDSTARTFAGLVGIERVSVPVYNEGGNFMTNGRGDCLMTTRVTDANNDIFKAGDIILDAEAVKQYYGEFAGCQRTTIFPRMPREKTGHIDMWGKFLDDDTVIVNQISDETLAYASAGNRALASELQKYFDNRADDIEALGFKVVRIPMPVPSIGLFRSYTNSLLLNGVAIIPRYNSASGGSYADQKLLSSYEAKVRQIYEGLGYKAVFIPSDQLIATGGAIHCVTMQVPAAL